MPPRLLFPDAASAADVLVFAERSARLGDGALHLRARGGTLTVTSAPLAPCTLLEATPTVLGMRAARVDAELVCDLVVDATRLTASADDPTAIDLPESGVSAAWAGISPPRTGWVEVDTLGSDVLRAVADRGVAEVARAVPVDAGEDAVRAVRVAVWSVPAPEAAGLPAGVAFAALCLGFLGESERARVLRAGPWTRLSLRRGHVLHKLREPHRGPTRAGLTAVRATGHGGMRG
ncbi:MAG: hypothetical protein QM677_08955 [Microbacterium sp.]